MRKKGVAVLAAGLAALAATTGALASAVWGNSPRTEPVAATFTLNPVDVKQRTCIGADGPYLEIRSRYEGPEVGHPRLTGILEVRAEHLINLATGYGTAEGTFTLKDPATGRTKEAARFWGVYTEVVNFHGFALGTMTGTGEGADGGGSLTGFFSSVVDPATGIVTGQVGGAAPTNRTPAVIQRGSCAGPWQ